MYLLDTNIISAWINKNWRVKEKFREVLSSGQALSMSAVSYYEIKRGLLAVNATRKLRNFEALRHTMEMLFLDTQEVFDKAVAIHVSLKRKDDPSRMPIFSLLQQHKLKISFSFQPTRIFNGLMILP